MKVRERATRAPTRRRTGIPVYLRGRASIFCQVQAFMHFIVIILKCFNKILSAALRSVCAEPLGTER